MLAGRRISVQRQQSRLGIADLGIRQNLLTSPPLSTAGERSKFIDFAVRTGSRERLPLGLRPTHEDAVRTDRIVNAVSIEPVDCCCLMAENFDINVCQRFDLI